ncbi:CPBP family intramembrane glutamic endopeptidase [Nonomuraea sediminis]|uniref:CPBP family intramembrane glutamic endopeptidase n=1 Tax=Nonomuraea sediminis TaxID=2835864 RepID=UPI001BDCD24F|nr:type II CAAX endopeptidase family protein [Nonomuraea sediminis]
MKSTLISAIVTVAGLFASIICGSLPASLLFERTNLVREPLAALGVTSLAVLLVWLVRRYLAHRPWQGLHLTRSWSALPKALLGLGAAMAAVIAANALSAALGVATWPPAPEPSKLLALPLVIATIVLGQAFPEELWFRGHLFDMLSERFSPRAVLVISSVAFGSIHIFSQSSAQGLAERLIFVAQAMTLGLACGAARSRTGTLWAAIGFHTGFHIGYRLLPVQPTNFGVQLVILAATTTVVALLFLLKRRAPSPISLTHM